MATSKRQGIECREVVRALHNLSITVKTGSPAPAFPNNRIFPYFLEEMSHSDSKEVQGDTDKQGVGNDVCDELIRFFQEEKDDTSWK